MTELERFWSKVEIDWSKPDACWVWASIVKGSEYGRFRIGSQVDGTRRQVQAHRYAYELLVGPIPEGLQIDHLCRNPACVNPTHLEAVTHAENIRRGASQAAVNARKTHCPQGHPYDEANTRVTPKGERRCRACTNERRRRYRDRRVLSSLKGA